VRPQKLSCDLGSFGRVVLRCKIELEIRAAGGKAALVQLVESLLADLADIHQPGLTQDGKMVGYRGLRDVQMLDNLIDRQPLAAADLHDLLTGIVGQCFRKENGARITHIDLLLYVLYR